MIHPLEARGWTLKVRYASKPFPPLHMGRWWHDLSGIPRFSETSFVARVIEGKEDNPPEANDAGKREGAGKAQAGDDLQG